MEAENARDRQQQRTCTAPPHEATTSEGFSITGPLTLSRVWSWVGRVDDPHSLLHDYSQRIGGEAAVGGRSSVSVVPTSSHIPSTIASSGALALLQVNDVDTASATRGAEARSTVAVSKLHPSLGCLVYQSVGRRSVRWVPFRFGSSYRN